MTGIKETARSVFSVIVVGLLITSLIGPAAFAGTATAETGIDEASDCGWRDPLEYLVGSTCDWHGQYDQVNNSDDREDAYVQADHHATLRGEVETAEQFRTVFKNYGEDTGTIASLEARNAIATAYQNNKSASTADAKAQDAIQDYYSKKEINTLEAFSKQQAQLAYAANSTRNHPTTLDRFVYGQFSPNSSAGTIKQDYYTGKLETRNYTLSNGTVYQYKSAQFFIKSTDGTNTNSVTTSLPITAFQGSDKWTKWDIYDYAVDHNGLTNVKASYAGTNLSISNGHPSQVVVDYNSWAAVLTMWKTQSDTVEANYQTGTASDLYTEMDADRLDPADVRGAEGQVRYLSGDSNVTTQRYKAALYGVLNMSQAGYNSTFTVEYTGYTERHYNTTTDGTRTVEYTNYVENKTYEGIVFSSSIPSGGFQPGNTYDTTNLNGTTMIYSQNSGPVTFAKGNVTVTKIVNQNGTSVDSVSWEKPQYSTNNVDDYINYLEKTQKMQMRLLEQYSDTTSSGSTTTQSSGWNPTQSQLVFILLAVASMAAMSKRGAQ